MISEQIKNIFYDLKNRDGWANDAFFGFSQIKPYLKQLQQNDSVLEVGSGSGILLYIIKKKFPDINIEGIESCEDGFNYLGKYHKKLIKTGVKIHNEKYENFILKKEYKLIFLINVFEHLSDWKHFLDFINKTLLKNGKCIILCPNYSFPYESHFRIPIIFNKKITYKLFSSYILNYEEVNNCKGLWDSLNFVKYSDVRLYAKKIGLGLSFDNDIGKILLERQKEDKEFRERQNLLLKLSMFLTKLGFLKLLKYSFFYRFSPYIKIELYKYSDGNK